MSYKVITIGSFERELKRLTKKYPSLKHEYIQLAELKRKPDFGSPVGKDCFKIRIAIASKGKGKRGGARVITHIVVRSETVYLVSIYDKSEVDNISDSDLQRLIDSLDRI